jgi:hypothetical protein
MKETKVVHHWRFEDGEVRSYNHEHGVIDTPDPMPRGWYCWVFPQDNDDFIGWMNTYCPTADHTFRFNSGNPMHTVYISDDAEAVLFSLKYGTN